MAPLALVVGAFAMLFQGLKLLVTNWRLTLVEILPAMWIWAAMLDLKLHVFRGKEFHIVRGPLLIPILLVIAAITAASFYLNAVFAFAIAKPGTPQIRPAFAQAREHLRPILVLGHLAIGIALWFATIVVQRWGKDWYRRLPEHRGGGDDVRLRGRPVQAGRDQVGPIETGQAHRHGRGWGHRRGGLLTSVRPGSGGHPAAGSHTFRVLAVIMLAVAVVLQTGATTATKAIKFSAKLVVSPTTPASDTPDARAEDADDIVDAATADPAIEARAAGSPASSQAPPVVPSVPAVASDEV